MNLVEAVAARPSSVSTTTTTGRLVNNKPTTTATTTTTGRPVNESTNFYKQKCEHKTYCD